MRMVWGLFLLFHPTRFLGTFPSPWYWVPVIKQLLQRQRSGFYGLIASIIVVFFNTSFPYLYLQVSLFLYELWNFCKLIFLIMLFTMWDLPCDRGSNQYSLQWKHGFLTTGWPRRSQEHGFWAKPWKAPLAGGKGAPGEREKQVLLNLCLPGTRTNPSRAWAMNLRVTFNKEWGEPGTGASLDLKEPGGHHQQSPDQLATEAKDQKLAEQEERGDLGKKEVAVY